VPLLSSVWIQCGPLRRPRVSGQMPLSRRERPLLLTRYRGDGSKRNGRSALVDIVTNARLRRTLQPSWTKTKGGCQLMLDSGVCPSPPGSSSSLGGAFDQWALMPLASDLGHHWEPGAPAAVRVPLFLGLTGGGPHHAVARAFVGPRARTAYVLLPPSHATAAAFRWTTRPTGESPRGPSACSCPPSPADVRRGRLLVVKVQALDVDSFVAPTVLPWRLRSELIGRTRPRDLRVCHCLLHGHALTPVQLAEFDAHLSSLLGIPRPGSLSQWLGRRPQRCACVRGCRAWADPGSPFCDFCFGETVPQPGCDCPAGCCGVPHVRDLRATTEGQTLLPTDWRTIVSWWAPGSRGLTGLR